MNNYYKGTSGGWKKYDQNPVLGGNLGTCFDISVIKQADLYKMFFSWRPKKCVAVCESLNGLQWSEPRICIDPRSTEQGWEDDINRPTVIVRDGVYHMWYTGQFLPGEAGGTSHIFYARSLNGFDFERVQETPVLYPWEEWEKNAVMNPDAMWDEDAREYKMWYCGGEQYEPNAIGYASSPDGIHWTKHRDNPVFQADADSAWERHKVAGCNVRIIDGQYVLFYIGYHNENYAQIGIARSPDGIRDWQRHPKNPVIAPDPGGWDADACYKPCVLFDGEKWLMWYNGRNSFFEQIGVAFHDGIDLEFDVE